MGEIERDGVRFTLGRVQVGKGLAHPPVDGSQVADRVIFSVPIFYLVNLDDRAALLDDHREAVGGLLRCDISYHFITLHVL